MRLASALAAFSPVKRRLGGDSALLQLLGRGNNKAAGSPRGGVYIWLRSLRTAARRSLTPLTQRDVTPRGASWQAGRGRQGQESNFKPSVCQDQRLGLGFFFLFFFFPSPRSGEGQSEKALSTFDPPMSSSAVRRNVGRVSGGLWLYWPQLRRERKKKKVKGALFVEL